MGIIIKNYGKNLYVSFKLLTRKQLDYVLFEKYSIFRYFKLRILKKISAIVITWYGSFHIEGTT
ncbi:MAG: hypothetical protein CES88_13580 [Halobacteriovorax sp. JY17]|nr:MAG: hypothetical protein CES88_13580 [Halobacteriovorax sp. JY17]